ncbi:hypothetical protein [Limibacterium fermenti]|uniref:hypothetical protein n=1 Tax=Limibacterium fermenti TaxID=3229863 RepID=UPI003A7869C0
MKRTSSIFLLSLILLGGCGAPRQAVLLQTAGMQNAYERYFIDSILQYGLDHEALYTMLGSVKPMSSLVSFSFPVANTDTVSSVKADVVDRKQQGASLDRLFVIQQALNKIDLPDLRFVMLPYRASYEGDRIMQINVVRVSALDSLLKVRESFFGQFGLVPGADPAVVVNTLEFNDRYERLRGYGYLFGYPDYAVDFFVKAFQEDDVTGNFVERNFFQIPTQTREDGYFVYAYPKGHTPTVEPDSAIYYKAQRILNRYRDIRDNYLNADSTLQAYNLLRDHAAPARR